jgi:iron(III) transport system permease protein
MTGLALFVGFLVLYPLGTLLYGSILSAGPGRASTLTLDNYISAYTDSQTYQLIVTTAVLAGGKTILATILAVSMAVIVVRTDTPMRRWLELLIALPFFVPGILEAIGWIMLLSPKAGAINFLSTSLLGRGAPTFSIYSLGGMIWVLMLNSSAFIFLLVANSMRSMDASLEEAAFMSGAGGWRVTTRITLPLLTPAILGASLLSFIRALEAFEVPVLIGLPAKVFVFPNRIYAAVEYDTPSNYGLATALGVSLIVITLSLVWVQNRLVGPRQFAFITGKGYRPRILALGPAKYVTFAFCVLFFFITAVLPISQLVIGSVSRTFGLWEPTHLTTANYARVLSDDQLWRGLRNTVLIGGITAILCMLMCALVAYVIVRTKFPGRHFLDFASWLPWTIPGIVASLGMLWAYIRFPIPIYGTVFLLGVAFLTSGIPLGVRLMSGVMGQIGSELEESARVMGASWRATFRRVVLPLAKPALLAGSVLLFVNFSRALSSVVLLSGPGTELLSVVMFKYFNGGRVEAVCALAVIMLGINVSGLALARRLGFFGAEASRL